MQQPPQWAKVDSRHLPLMAKMSSREVRVFIALLMHGTGGSWPSIPRLAAMSGIHPRDCSRALAGLERLGAIQREQRPGTTTMYRIQAGSPAEPAAPVPVELPAPPPPPAPPPTPAPAPRVKPIGFAMRDELEAARAARPAPPPSPPPPAPSGAMAVKLEHLRQGKGLDLGPAPQPPPPPAARQPAPQRPVQPGRRPETDEEVAAALEEQGKDPEVVRLAVEALQQARDRPGGVTSPWGFAQAAARRVEGEMAAEDDRRARIRAQERAQLEAERIRQETPCAEHGKRPPCKECSTPGMDFFRRSVGLKEEEPPKPAPSPAIERQPPCPVCGYRASSPGPCLACERERLRGGR